MAPPVATKWMRGSCSIASDRAAASVRVSVQVLKPPLQRTAKASAGKRRPRNRRSEWGVLAGGAKAKKSSLAALGMVETKL